MKEPKKIRFSLVFCLKIYNFAGEYGNLVADAA